ncbi:hypothetical protein KFU94_18645 [Chloroflexi bacterium TSY]|nr:hypothetical protein [Chloroflexi bacterium TSY]
MTKTDLSDFYNVDLYRWFPLFLLFITIITILLWQRTNTLAQSTANCSENYYIDEVFESGGRWQMCWEHRTLDGIVLHDLFFTPANGERRRVMSQAGLAQIHVPYDDNGARFHDVTDDGLGNRNLRNLTTDECPEGRLLQHGGKNVLCLQIQPRGHAFKGVDQKQGHILSLFSVSTSGDYNYIPKWHFWDDGTIEPLMGATGKLQRFANDTSTGWPIRANGTTGISHLHNYYWRLDFDLGDESTDDIVEEIDFTPAENNVRRQRHNTRLSQEAGRSINPLHMRSWRVRDGTIQNDDGHAISYHLEPLHVGHRDTGPTFEPWTANDFYVTSYNFTFW